VSFIKESSTILINTIFAQNFVFIRFLALCSFVGLTSNMESSIGMGGAVTFVTVMASIISYSIYHFLLVPLHIEYLETITFILTIAVFVQLVEIYLKKAIPNLYRAMGIYLPLIATNCMILAVTLLNITSNYSLINAIIFSIGASLGYTIALVILAGIRTRLKYALIPKFFEGYPIIFITASFIAIAFLGLQGIAR
jgi:Na+-translocating ferredoxin:NAD+ oxidoreductase subunit A